MRTLLLVLALVAIGCESSDASGGYGGEAQCYTTRPSKKCKPCDAGPSVSCTSCETITACDPCYDKAADGCWKGDIMVKCSPMCPSGSYYNGEQVK